MRAIDTNVLVRLITRDDAQQAQVAQTLLEGQLLILPTVLMESIWVLGSIYKMPRTAIGERLRQVLGYPSAYVVSGAQALWALERFERGADFADMLHLALAAEAEATDFATFDRKLAEAAGDAPIPVTSLA